MKSFILKGIKAYRTPIFPIETIAKVVPHLLADYFKTFMAQNMQGTTSPIGYDWGRLLEFQNNLGMMIMSKKFDYLDNVVLQFLKSYSHVFSVYRFPIKFPDSSVEKFKKICDSFKEREWNDIVDEFIDAVELLFSSGKILNKNLTY